MSETANKPAKQSWFKGLSAEFRKIIWPNKKTLAKESVAVVVITVILGAMIFLVDEGILFVLGKLIAL